MANPKHITKPATSAVKPITKEEQAAQIARFFSQKREQYFQTILANSLQAGAPLNLDTVDKALAAADYALEKLYPVPKEGGRETTER
ncbi:MAG: hypothetical protein IJ654_05420 [Bacteroidales bacterium]|nr:hypothetical protein [Bacteroidales bacterium]